MYDIQQKKTCKTAPTDHCVRSFERRYGLVVVRCTEFEGRISNNHETRKEVGVLPTSWIKLS